MAVPSLPTDVPALSVFTSARVNEVYDHLEWHRQGKPVFLGEAGQPFGVFGDVLTATETSFHLGGDGAFINTPDINIGGWTVEADASGTLGTVSDLVVPEPGYYRIDARCTWGSDPNNRRRLRVFRNGSGSMPFLDSQVQANSAGSTTHHCAGPNRLDAGDLISLSVNQNSGSTLTVSLYVALEWIAAI